jgi:hypothetical protein
MIWGLVPGHDLATPFVVPRALDADTIIRTIIHKMSDLGDNAYQDTDEGRIREPDWSNHQTQRGSVVTLAIVLSLRTKR